MAISLPDAFIIAALSAALGQAPTATSQALDAVTDPEAYAIYAAVLPPAWRNVSKEALRLQQETEIDSPCRSIGQGSDAEWQGVENNFRAENARVRVIQRMLPISIPYRLIPRAQIAADDARLKLKYPGTWQRRPESIEYAAVSAVGFNSTKTKAIVYVRLRSRGHFSFMEKNAGKWTNAPHGGYGWIA